MPFALYCASKLSSYHCNNFICCTLYGLHLSIYGCHEDAFVICMELGVLQTIKVAIRNGKFTNCRLQIVHESEQAFILGNSRSANSCGCTMSLTISVQVSQSHGHTSYSHRQFISLCYYLQTVQMQV